VPDRLVQSVRLIGFRGSGQNYRKVEGEFVFVVNFQGSRSEPRFFINLGAQPTFIPTEGHLSHLPGDSQLREYDCVFRTRVGEGNWPWDLSDCDAAVLAETFTSQAHEFFERVQTLRAGLAAGEVERLITDLKWGVPPARAALHLARASQALGYVDQARRMAEQGLVVATGRATILRQELQALLGALL
jgi:hypothetical protein